MNIKIRCAHDQMIPIGDLKPHPKNRNKHPDEQIVRLAQILEYQGWRQPIKVSRLSGFITAGHGRLLAAQKLGLTEVPVNFQEYESDAQEYADLTADNAIALWAEIDLVDLRDDMKSFSDLDVNLLGLNGFQIEEPNFSPGNENDQGSLDKKQLKFLTCPHCQQEFEIGQAKMRTQD